MSSFIPLNNIQRAAISSNDQNLPTIASQSSSSDLMGNANAGGGGGRPAVMLPGTPNEGVDRPLLQGAAVPAMEALPPTILNARANRIEDLAPAPADFLNLTLNQNNNNSVVIDIAPSSSSASLIPLPPSRYSSAAPYDVFSQIFSFLDSRSLCAAATVNRSWQQLSYDEALWTRLDLSHSANRVDNSLIRAIFGPNDGEKKKTPPAAASSVGVGTIGWSRSAQNRFSSLLYLSLEGCGAITDDALELIARSPCARSLRVVLLTDCKLLTANGIVNFARSLTSLKKLELYGTNDQYDMAVPILAHNPTLDLGFFFMEFAARKGIQIDESAAHFDVRYMSDNELKEGGFGGVRRSSYSKNYRASVMPVNVRRPVNLNASATCRHEGAGGGARGCWGPVKGRVIYSNRIYHLAGNYPAEILYSCASHSDTDFADPDFAECTVCMANFRASSMLNPLVCRVCFDNENLTNPKNWIPLSRQAIDTFTVGDIVNKTIHVADRKNLPKTLRRYAHAHFRLDYTLPTLEEKKGDNENDDEENNEENRPLLNAGGNTAADAHRVLAASLAPLDEENPPPPAGPPLSNSQPFTSSSSVDPKEVPLPVFLDCNRQRVNDAVDNIRAGLKNAKMDLNSRALLVYDENKNIELFADRRVILDGREGEEHMRLTLQAWYQSLDIMMPVLAVMIIASHFIFLFRSINLNPAPTADYTAYIRSTKQEDLAVQWVLITIAIVFFVLGAVIFCAYRYREQCERCFKRFLVADILMILGFGGAAMLFLLSLEFFWPLDILFFCFLVWNFAVIGLCSLYLTVPHWLHHIYLILLNCVMAVLLSVTLPNWLIVLFLGIASSADVMSELRPRLRVLSPFIIPQGVQFLYETPRILYTVGGLRLRAADLMWYGLMMGLVTPLSITGVALTVLCVMISVGIICFVLPFLGKRFRPLPIAYILVLIMTGVVPALFNPFHTDRFFLNTSNPTIKYPTN